MEAHITVARFVATMTEKERSRHGYRAAKVAIKLRGMRAINRNSRAGRDLFEWRSKLVADLGGESSLSAAKLALIDTACRTRALLDHADAWLLSRDSIVDKRKRRLIGLVDERMRLADALQRQLTALGLERSENASSGLPEAWITKVEPTLDEPDTQEETQQ